MATSAADLCCQLKVASLYLLAVYLYGKRKPPSNLSLFFFFFKEKQKAAEDEGIAQTLLNKALVVQHNMLQVNNKVSLAAVVELALFLLGTTI